MQHQHLYGWILFSVGLLVVSGSIRAFQERLSYWRMACIALGAIVGVPALIAGIVLTIAKF